MNKSLIAFFIFTLVSSVGCNRKGCTDLDASNYSSKAKKNNNTCQYTANGMIWFDQAKWLEFNGMSMSTVHFSLDGESIGFVEVTSYTGTTPSCGSPKGLALTRSLGKSKSKTYLLKVSKANGDLLDTYTYTMTANECSTFKLPD